MRHLIYLALLVAPLAAHAAGTEEQDPPETTKTTAECADGTIWDETAKACVAPKDSSLQQGDLYRAVRELAYAGRFHSAQDVLALLPANDDKTLTYMAFTEGKLGRMDSAMAYYTQALAKNPNNLLARSYMGQALIQQNKLAEAIAQLAEIRARGGAGRWPETALSKALETGHTFDY